MVGVTSSNINLLWPLTCTVWSRLCWELLAVVTNDVRASISEECAASWTIVPHHLAFISGRALLADVDAVPR